MIIIICDDQIWCSYMMIINDHHHICHLGSSGSHLGDIWEPLGIHLGDIWEGGGWRGIWRSDLILLASLSNRMHKFNYNFNFTIVFWGYHWVWLHIYSNICARQRPQIPGTLQGPFTKTVRTPIAKASLGNLVIKPHRTHNWSRPLACLTSQSPHVVL